MFLDELTPLFQELTRQPVAFLGGFVSGVLRVGLNEDPVKTWLERQDLSVSSTGSSDNHSNNGQSSGPQSISIE
jgi:hypothetical protein